MAEPLSSALLAGTIVKAQGIKGEVRIRPYTDSAEDWLSIRRVMLDGEFKRVRNQRIIGQQVIAVIEGVYDRNHAELLRGKNLYIQREDGPALEENRWFIADLIGCDMIDDHGEAIGTIVDVLQPAGNNLLQITTATGSVLVPFLKDLLVSIDTQNRKVVVNAGRLAEVRCDED